MSVVVMFEPIIPDFEKSELIGWHIQSELKGRKSNKNDKRDVLRSKALDNECELLKAMDVDDFFRATNNEVFSTSFGSYVGTRANSEYIESYRFWYSFFEEQGLVQEYLSWLSYSWIIPTTSYYRWPSGVDFRRENKLNKRFHYIKEIEHINTPAMTSKIDRFWQSPELNSLSQIEKKAFNILIDLGITLDTKELIIALPSSVLKIMYDALHMSLAKELANNPEVMFKPRFGFREGSSIFYWSGKGRIPLIMKDKVSLRDKSQTRLGSDLMREWRKRTQALTKVHTYNFVEVQICGS